MPPHLSFGPRFHSSLASHILLHLWTIPWCVYSPCRKDKSKLHVVSLKPPPDAHAARSRQIIDWLMRCWLDPWPISRRVGGGAGGSTFFRPASSRITVARYLCASLLLFYRALSTLLFIYSVLWPYPSCICCWGSCARKTLLITSWFTLSVVTVSLIKALSGQFKRFCWVPTWRGGGE